MNIEIEAKLKVDSLEPIARKLPQIGAKAGGAVLQTDYYFDDDKGTLAKSDKALRLRNEAQDGKEKNVFAYKGPREQGRFKRRQEIQFGTDNVEQAIALFAALGFEKSLVFQKRRQLWQLEGCDVALDELPLIGTFVEIEGPSEEKIAQVQSKLGLAALPHVQESYATLMWRHCEQTGLGKREIYF
jgi:adenylate cyclase class 2